MIVFPYDVTLSIALNYNRLNPLGRKKTGLHRKI